MAATGTLDENLATAARALERFRSSPLLHHIAGQATPSVAAASFENTSPIDGSRIGDVAAGGGWRLCDAIAHSLAVLPQQPPPSLHTAHDRCRRAATIVSRGGAQNRRPSQTPRIARRCGWVARRGLHRHPLPKLLKPGTRSGMAGRPRGVAAGAFPCIWGAR